MKKWNLYTRFIAASTHIAERFLPDAFVFAAALTTFVLLSGIIFTKQPPVAMINHWYSGFWNLHAFAMQMSLIVITGYSLALSPFFNKMLKSMASIPKTSTQGILIVTFVSAIACWINWGFGLVIGAIYAREVAKKVPNIDYRLLIASAYSGFLVWHAGLTGSIPLKIATQEPDLERISGGVLTAALSIQETLFASFSIVPALILIFTLPIINALMHPKGNAIVSISPKLLSEDKIREEEFKSKTFAEAIDNSWVLSFLVGFMGLAYILSYFINNGFNLNLNIVIFIFFILSLLLHKTPKRFINSVQQSVKGVSGIIVQFPLYAGIMGMMQGINSEGQSLAMLITQLFVSIANADTLPFLSFIAASILNFFVPSGGGQWVIQGPVIMPAAAELGANYAKTAMSIAWGDALTNMVQPFWALPALGIAGLSARDIMGFCFISMIYAGIVITAALLFL